MSDDDNTTTEAEPDWKAEAQKWEKRAKQNNDAAKRLAGLEETHQSTADLEARANRAEVAAERGLPPRLLVGATREEIEASADTLIEWRGQLTPRRRPEPVVPDEDGIPALAGTAITPGLGRIGSEYQERLQQGMA